MENKSDRVEVPRHGVTKIPSSCGAIAKQSIFKYFGSFFGFSLTAAVTDSDFVMGAPGKSDSLMVPEMVRI